MDNGKEHGNYREYRDYLGIIWDFIGIIGYMLGLDVDNGKEHGNYYNGL